MNMQNSKFDTSQLHEARYYTVQVTTRGSEAVCHLCPHQCHIESGSVGRCRSRLFADGKLWALSYAEPCAVALDPVEKKPLLHFHPGMECLSLACTGCNLRCLNCQNYDISQASPHDVRHARLTPDGVVAMCERQHAPAIAYTYTEPLTWMEYLTDTARKAHQHGLLNVLVSAGYVNPEPLHDVLPYLDAANIDLKAFSDEVYHRLNGASLQPVLNTLQVLRQSGVWLEITNLLIPQWNTDEKMLRQMCRWLVDNGFADVPLHFSRFFPTFRLTSEPPTPLATLLKAREIARHTGMHYVYIGNATEVNGQDTCCPDCGKLLVERHGYSVESNLITADGCCPGCGCRVAGRW